MIDNLLDSRLFQQNMLPTSDEKYIQSLMRSVNDLQSKLDSAIIVVQARNKTIADQKAVIAGLNEVIANLVVEPFL